MVSDGGELNTVNMLGTGLSSEDTQDTCAASNIKHDLVLEDLGVIHNGIFVGKGSVLRRVLA